MFQSTHPRGVRRQSISVYVSVMSFNPRTHVGCDENPWVCPRDKTFQSTHPRGVRLQNLISDGSEALFQSTHPRGVRHGAPLIIS